MLQDKLKKNVARITGPILRNYLNQALNNPAQVSSSNRFKFKQSDVVKSLSTLTFFTESFSIYET